MPLKLHEYDETDFSGGCLAHLNKAVDVAVTEDLQQTHTLSFEYPLYDDKADMITEHRIVSIEGQAYRLNYVTRDYSSKRITAKATRIFFIDALCCHVPTIGNDTKITMKKKIITLTLIAALSVSTTAFAAPVPRESAPLNATEAQIQITENIIGDILDEVQTGSLGYTLAAGYANTKIRKAVMANQTDGNGYGILSPIAQNAIRVMRDRQLRPDAYAQAEEELKVLLADVITAVQNGMDIDTATKEAYAKIYQSVNPNFNYDEQFSLDTCYRDIPTVGMEKFTVARKLLLEAVAK